MERKEMQKTFLQVLRYIFESLKRKDGGKRNPLAGDDVSLKMQFARQENVNLDRLIEISTITH